MAPSIPAHVTPAVLRWARESIGYSVEDAAAKARVPADKLERAERGEQRLTLRQAERAAHAYDRPLAALFLAEPPVEEPQEAQFRRLPGAPTPPWQPAMTALARRVRQRQEAAVELYELLEEELPWQAAQQRLRADRHLLPQIARQELAVREDEQTSWRDSTGFTPLRAWIEAVESLGVLVMQDGGMTVEEMRGFAAPHPLVPAIVVNTKDDPRARAFTIVHELGHLVLLAIGESAGPETEAWCEDFAGEVIVPSHWLERAFRRVAGRPLLDAIDELALHFGVTPRAAAVRLGRARIVPWDDLAPVLDRIRARGKRARGSGGNWYRGQVSRLGPAFIRLVFDAVDGQAVTLSNAAGLLGTKVNNFDELRRTLAQRTALE